LSLHKKKRCVEVGRRRVDMGVGCGGEWDLKGKARGSRRKRNELLFFLKESFFYFILIFSYK
jgi:hypothetical protein